MLPAGCLNKLAKNSTSSSSPTVSKAPETNKPNKNKIMFSPWRQSSSLAKRRDQIETYTEPILCNGGPDEMQEIRIFLSNFYRTVYQRHDEFEELMREYPDTLGKHYKHLVLDTHKVAYEDFWQRYLFKCDENRYKQRRENGKSYDYKYDEEDTQSMSSSSSSDTEDEGVSVFVGSVDDTEDEGVSVLVGSVDDDDDATVKWWLDDDGFFQLTKKEDVDIKKEIGEISFDNDDDYGDDSDSEDEGVVVFGMGDDDITVQSSKASFDGTNEGVLVGADDNSAFIILQALVRGYLIRTKRPLKNNT